MAEYRGLSVDNALVRAGFHVYDQEAVEFLAKDERVAVIQALRVARGYVTIWNKHYGATREEGQMKRENEDQREASARLDAQGKLNKPTLTEKDPIEILAKIKAAEVAAEDFYAAVNVIEQRANYPVLQTTARTTSAGGRGTR